LLSVSLQTSLSIVRMSKRQGSPHRSEHKTQGYYNYPRVDSIECRSALELSVLTGVLADL